MSEMEKSIPKPKKEKPVLTSEQIYKRNKNLTKLFKILAVVSLYLFIVLGVLLFGLAIRNSIGNVVEILSLLDEEVYNKTELLENYYLLAEKWGEWELVGASIRYIDVGNALFSGLLFTYATLMIISFCLSIVLGKIVFPILTKYYANASEEMVDLATLQSATQINELSKRKEWF